MRKLLEFKDRGVGPGAPGEQDPSRVSRTIHQTRVLREENSRFGGVVMRNPGRGRPERKKVEGNGPCVSAIWLRRPGFEAHQLLQEGQFHIAGRTVPVLGEDELSFSEVVFLLLVGVVPICSGVVVVFLPV